MNVTELIAVVWGLPVLVMLLGYGFVIGWDLVAGWVHRRRERRERLRW